MKKDRLDKFYPSFMGEERFRLHLEALYRGDEAEVKRLLESCPRESHERNEAAFAYRCKATREIVGMLCLALAPLLARLDTIESFREALPYLLKSYINEGVVAHFDGPQAGARRVWEAAGKTGEPPEWKARKEGDEGNGGPEMDQEMDQEMQILRSLTKRLEKTSGAVVSPLEQLKRELLEEALTIWTAFVNCCSEECGVEPEKLVKVWVEPMLPEIERLKHLSDSTEVTPEMLKEYKAAFLKVWSEIAA
jgi:hypothetical protein